MLIYQLDGQFLYVIICFLLAYSFDFVSWLAGITFLNEFVWLTLHTPNVSLNGCILTQSFYAKVYVRRPQQLQHYEQLESSVDSDGGYLNRSQNESKNAIDRVQKACTS